MLLAIALGGAVGSVARFLVGTFMQRASADFPLGTLLVNVSGSLLLGFLARSLTDSAPSPELRAALTIGLCGGYTTFSTFSLETVALMERGAYGRAAAYIVASVVLSVAATFAGAAAAKGLVARH
jgi:fluoride exporter